MISFPTVKWPARGADHPPLSSAEVKERVELPFWAFIDCPKATAFIKNIVSYFL
jgi:hypothetical protein